ncbi:MAG: hypothetical protein HZB71_10370 [Betaproteobacteria bacterium]|nr:hypothetical protein [Betaproteobacteria bacterium]
MLAAETKPSRLGPASLELSGLAVVALSDQGRGYGLYRVKRVEARTMVLGHGAISFPVGMHLDVEAFKCLAPSAADFRQRTTVVENSRDGIRLVW